MSNGTGGAVDADRHPEGQDGEEPPADVDIDVSTRGEFVAEVEREEHPALAIDRDVDLDRLDATHPAKRLAEARKQIALAMDDLAVDGGGQIPVVDDDGFAFSIVATDESVRLHQRAAGDVDDVRLDRPDALLVSKCLEVLALDS